MRHFVLAITGASGVIYGRRLAQRLAHRDVQLHLVVSTPARRVFADELGLRDLSVQGLIGEARENVTLYSYRDIGARIASGSFLTHGMAICPCSAHTLAAVAAGLADNLVTRAALVTMKEGRRLVIVPREMPLSTIELENLLRLSRAGVIVAPASPGFYARPQSVDDLVDFVVGRVMDLLGVEHGLETRWDPPAKRKPGP